MSSNNNNNNYKRSADQMVSINHNKLVAVCIQMHETKGKVLRCKRTLEELENNIAEDQERKSNHLLQLNELTEAFNQEIAESKRSAELFKIKNDLLIKQLKEEMDALAAPSKKLKL